MEYSVRVGYTNTNFQGDRCITECVLCLWMVEALGTQSPQLAAVECAQMCTVVVAVLKVCWNAGLLVLTYPHGTFSFSISLIRKGSFYISNIRHWLMPPCTCLFK